MTEAALTPERILDATEEVLRRFGPPKTTVVDVARALGVSHGSVYRHFESKAALMEAVAERWLARVSEPLASVVEERGPAPKRLRRWFDLLIATKRKKVRDDPELFAIYGELVAAARNVVIAHVEALTSQITKIIEDGVERGELEAPDPKATARAVFDATARFHNPVHAAAWAEPGIDAAFENVWSLILRGLLTRAAKSSRQRSSAASPRSSRGRP